MPDRYSFIATIYKEGINPCVDVPLRISRQLQKTKGYIPVKGTINGFAFMQTLMPVKDGLYRLFVNGPMLNGGKTRTGTSARFILQQHVPQTVESIPFPHGLQEQLQENNVMEAFENLTSYRRKEILRYLNYLKTPEALERNIKKVIHQLQNKN